MKLAAKVMSWIFVMIFFSFPPVKAKEIHVKDSKELYQRHSSLNIMGGFKLMG
jgi:hypothetical protein